MTNNTGGGGGGSMISKHNSTVRGCCPECGGLIGEQGKSYGYLGKWCQCIWGKTCPVNPAPQTLGWQCPKCNKIHNPNTAYCTCLIQEKFGEAK